MLYQVPPKPKHWLLTVSLSLCGMREKHPLAFCSVSTQWPLLCLCWSALSLYSLYKRLCTGLVLEILLLAHIPSNCDVIGSTSGRGRATRRDKSPVCSCALACFLCLDHRNNVIWFSSLYWQSIPAPSLPTVAVAQYCVLLHVCLLFQSNWMSLINLIWGLFINVLRVCLHGLVQTRTPGSWKEGQRPFQENTNNSLWIELHMEQLVCLLDMKYIMTIQMSKAKCSNLEARRGATRRHN